MNAGAAGGRAKGRGAGAVPMVVVVVAGQAELGVVRTVSGAGAGNAVRAVLAGFMEPS